LPAQQEKKSLLVIDQGISWATRFYYGRFNVQKTFVSKLIECLKDLQTLGSLIVRLHPDSDTKDVWAGAAKEFPDKVEIEKMDASMLDSLRKASVAIGLFSGALTVAAACGVPSFFMWHPGWFYTSDLSCFKQNCFVQPDRFIPLLKTLLTDASEYLKYRDLSIAAAAKYYHRGTSCAFDKEFMDKLLER
jgi:hypothetical protein